MEQEEPGYVQLQKGPNVIGPYGLLQLVADAVQLLIEEPLWPATSSIPVTSHIFYSRIYDSTYSSATFSLNPMNIPYPCLRPSVTWA